MEFKQSTIQDIIESEKEMVLRGEEMYGEYFKNAADFNSLLNNFIKSIDDPTKFIFIAFLSQVKKHHTLALFSAVRLHHIQMNSNLRQVLEATAWAAYALGNPEKEKFCEEQKNGSLEVPQRLKEKRDKWLDQNFKPKSEEIKKLKELINKSTAHSNIVYAQQNFKMNGNIDAGFNIPFFDFADEYKIKTDLWSVANVALGILDLFYGANLKYKVFQLTDDFLQQFRELVKQNDKLKAEMMKEKRYIAAVERDKK